MYQYKNLQYKNDYLKKKVKSKRKNFFLCFYFQQLKKNYIMITLSRNKPLCNVTWKRLIAPTASYPPPLESFQKITSPLSRMYMQNFHYHKSALNRRIYPRLLDSARPQKHHIPIHQPARPHYRKI